MGGDLFSSEHMSKQNDIVSRIRRLMLALDIAAVADEITMAKDQHGNLEKREVGFEARTPVDVDATIEEIDGYEVTGNIVTDVSRIYRLMSVLAGAVAGNAAVIEATTTQPDTIALFKSYRRLSDSVHDASTRIADALGDIAQQIDEADAEADAIAAEGTDGGDDDGPQLN